MRFLRDKVTLAKISQPVFGVLLYLFIIMMYKLAINHSDVQWLYECDQYCCFLPS